MRVWKLFAIGALAAFGLVACAELNPDINRVHKPYIAKDQFKGSWYFKKTVVDTAPTNQWVSQGDGDWAVIERIRWKITQDAIWGYRDWEYIPGSETAEYEGSDYYGSPVVAYAIKEHFDIRRSYNPQTGEETNVIEKNTERPWNEREYMVVDWTNNIAPGWGLINWTFGIPISDITTGGYYVQEHESDNPDHARFSSNYMDFVGKYTVWPDLFGCYFYYDVPDCAPGEIHVRHSFMKVDENDAYEPMYFPDSVDLVDQNGDYVRDSDGNVKRVPIFERFGDYRLDRLTYDQHYGVTESGVSRRAARFDIWERDLDDNGNPIPYHLRTPKPINYYLNVEFPDDEDMDPDLRAEYGVKLAAYEVGKQWNTPFRRTVASLRAMSRNGKDTATEAEIEAELSSVPDMFVVHDNDCNIDNVKSFYSQHEAELAATLDEHIGGIGNLDKANLPTACSLIEVATADSGHAFTWQRHGDLRYNMIIWVPKPIEAGWIGLGPMFMDPITGKILSSTAHYAGALAETYATRVLDYLDAMNGAITEHDIITGQYISRYIRDVRNRLREQSGSDIGRELVEDMNHRFNKFGGDRERLFREISPGFTKARLEMVKDTPAESLLINENDWAMAQRVADPAAAANLDSDVFDLANLASPARAYRRDMFDRRNERMTENLKRARHMPEFWDSTLIKTALDVKDEPYEKRLAMLRYRLLVAIMTHEVGHNVGMRHNFSASTDALNFGKAYWEIAALPQDLDDARTQLAADGDARVTRVDDCLDSISDPASPGYGDNMTTLECLGGWEKMYSSIMDYHGKITGDFNGASRYDDAFVQFVYGGLVEVFDDDAIDRTVLGGKDIKEWLFYNDYKRIPELFKGDVNNIDKRHLKQMTWGASQTTEVEPELTVPYKMCSDEYRDRLPDCRVHDYGANQTEIIESELTRYHEYYFFTHFNRGRTNWWWWENAVNSNMGVMFNILTTFQYMYFYRAMDPLFFETDAGKDYLRASVNGMNLYSEILGTPASGRHYELDNDGGMLVSSMRDGYWRVEPTADWLGGTTSNLPTEGGSSVLVESGYFDDCDEIGSNETYYIPLGDGRPFSFNYSEDYEEWLFTSVGSYFDKDNALFLMAYPNASFLPFNYIGGQAGFDPRTYSVNFFRLFKKEVLKAYYGVISGDLSEYAPVFRADGDDFVFEPRKFLTTSGELPSYQPGSDVKLVMPSMAYNIPFNAMWYGMALMNNLLDSEQDFAYLTKIAVKGQEDDIQDFTRIPEYDADGVKQKAEFTHPLSGVTYRALRQGETPIGFFLVEEANRRLARWRELQGCVDDENNNQGLCECTYQSQEQDPRTGNYTCPPRETIGCVMQDRVRRAEAAQETLERQVELMDNVRLFHDIFQYSL